MRPAIHTSSGETPWGIRFRAITRDLAQDGNGGTYVSAHMLVLSGPSAGIYDISAHVGGLPGDVRDTIERGKSLDLVCREAPLVSRVIEGDEGWRMERVPAERTLDVSTVVAGLYGKAPAFYEGNSQPVASYFRRPG